MECGGKRAECSPQGRRFLPPFHRYIDNNGYYPRQLSSPDDAVDLKDLRKICRQTGTKLKLNLPHHDFWVNSRGWAQKLSSRGRCQTSQNSNLAILSRVFIAMAAEQNDSNDQTTPSVEPTVVPSSAKPIHTIVLDSSPLLLNTPSLSTLLAKSHALVTTPSVIAEIKDPAARIRVENLYLPFITLRSPKPESIKFVKDFARRTGDVVVLSHTDVEVLALAYDLECERNGGDWRLRRVPGQKRVNGSPPVKVEQTKVEETHVEEKPEEDAQTVGDVEDLTQALQDTALGKEDMSSDPSERPAEEEQAESSDPDSEGWITPSNIKRHQAKDESSTVSTKSESKTLQVATMTGDFAMQNVLLQINLNLLSPATCKRIAHLKQTILRCHGCFFTTKDMNKQFCPRCGKPTLTRVSCTTNDKGEVKLHLKANMQWNNRGNVFSIPKPVSGTSNQKWQGPRHGGGQGGWGSDLVLAEDQKEYVRAMTSGSRTKNKDLMDEDYLPNILTGDRNRGSDRVRVGAGRNINSKKR
jgi:RNA-binding protein NOB1